MGTNFKPAEDWIVKLVEKVKANHFPDLADAKMLVVLDTQKRTGAGYVVPGTIKPASAEVRFFTDDDDLNYKIVLDEKIFKNWDDTQQLNYIHWLLCHCAVVTENEEPRFKTVGCEYPMFAAHMEFNSHWKKTWDGLRADASKAHASKSPVNANDKDFPHMFTTDKGKPLVKCAYPDTRAEACGPCDESENCGACCYGCMNQQDSREPDMAPSCELLHENAGEAQEEAA